MPYIIVTMRPDKRPSRVGHADDRRIVTRRAVTTLDEARELAAAWVGMRTEPTGRLDAGAPCPADARVLPESGGTIGPLPDGTVIEVSPVSWAQLTNLSSVGAKRPGVAVDILEAYNMRESK